MDTVIITIRLSGAADTKDFEIPASMTALELLTHMEEPFHIRKAGCRLKSGRTGRVLDTDETLEEAGIWDGDMLTISRQ